MAEIFSKKKEPFLVTTGLFFSITVQIESLIYKEQDINARYEYLIREAKKRGIKVSMEHIFKNARISII